jgi:hypothetical protein
LSSFLFLPLLLVPMFMLLTSNDPTVWLENPVLWIAIGLGFLWLIVTSYGVGSIIRPMLVVGALKAERGAERLSFGELFQEGRTYFWRFLGLMILFALSIMLVNSVFSAIQIIGILVTMGLASLCLTPLSFLLYPIMYIGMTLLEISEASIVVDGLGVMDALRRGWEVMRANKMPVFLVALVMYVGVGMVSMFVILPFMLPFMVMPMFMIDESLPREILWGLAIWSVVFFPIMAFVQGVVLVFMKTGWVLTYQRLTRKPDPSSVVLETTQSA